MPRSKRLKKLKKIYSKEFFQHETMLIKSRVRFFCVLAIFIYLLATAMSFVILPRTLATEEINMFKLLVLATALIYLFVGWAKTRIVAKIYAYTYTVLLLYIITQLNIVYPMYISISSVTYLFTFFLVCLSIPWNPGETFFISVLHILAYTGLFMHTHNNLSENIKASFDVFHYFGGFIFLCMAFVLSFTVRRKEAKREIENFVLMQEQKTRNDQIKKELNLAAKVYETIIPKPTSTQRVDIDVIYIPVSYLSGDYARYHFITDDLLIFIICDVTGHGVSAALLVNRLHTEFIRLVKENKEPAGVLNSLNSFLMKELGDLNIYTSAFCGVIDLRAMKLMYLNCGHPSQYLYSSKEDTIKNLASETTLLGIMPTIDRAFQKTLLIGPQDRIVLFTDGLIEIKNKEGEEYGKERLASFILRNPSLCSKDFNKELSKEIHQYREGSFKDDIFLMNITINKNI